LNFEGPVPRLRPPVLGLVVLKRLGPDGVRVVKLALDVVLGIGVLPPTAHFHREPDASGK